MVLSYDYVRLKRRRWQTKEPPLQAILMAMRRRWSNTCGIARCSMSRATPEATGRCHRATARSSLRIAPAIARATINKTTMENVPTLLACIARWRRSRAFIKATKRCNRASARSDSTNGTRQHRLIFTFHREKGSSWHVGPLEQQGYDISNWWGALN